MSQDVRRVLRCAIAANLAYLDGDRLKADSPAAGFTLVGPLQREEDNPNYGVVLDEPAVRIIAFRGTNEWADWLTNVNVIPRSTAWGHVHSGFAEATETFWPEIPSRVREARDAGRRVWLTGHSLGGAIAMLAAAKLAANDEGDVDLLCTFGQPPVGNSSFCSRCAQVFAGRYVRCVNHTDGVADPIFREHAGELWYFDVSGRLHHDVPFGISLSDHIDAPRVLGGLSMFVAHKMAGYVPLLQALVDDADAAGFSQSG
jgi:hypothetical protein